MLRDLWRSHTIQLIGATFLSGGLSGQFFSGDNFFLFLPPILWSLALCLTTQSNMRDRGYSYLAFTSFSVVLWMLVGVLSAVCTDVFQSSAFSAFSIVGAIGAMCSYWLFAKIVLDYFDFRYLLLCFALGYLAITLCQLQSRDNELLIQQRNLFTYWQTLVGIGHGVAYYKTVTKSWNNKKQLT